MPLVPFKLLPWYWSSKELSLSKSILGSLKGIAWGSRIFFHQLNPHCFVQPEVVGTYLPGAGTLLWGAWFKAGAPEISLPNFYPPHVDDGPACCVSVPLLPIWMDVGI